MFKDTASNCFAIGDTFRMLRGMLLFPYEGRVTHNNLSGQGIKNKNCIKLLITFKKFFALKCLS